MMNDLKNFALLLALLFVSLNTAAAEQAPAIAEPETTVEIAETKDEAPDTDTNAVEESKQAPKDTLDGAGLKNKKLSVVFEQFVPSETISADNAVPFPTDI